MTPILELESQQSCPLCGGTGHSLYENLQDRLFGVPGTFSIRACERISCRTLWLDPRPTPASVGAAYTNYYTHAGSGDEIDFSELPLREKLRRVWDDLCWRSHLEKRYGYDLLKPRFKPFASALAFIAKTRPSFCSEWDLLVRWQPADSRGRLIDIGCGNGDSIHFLSTLGWQVEGTDVDPSSVAVARARGLKIHHGDIATLDLPKGQYDFVTLSHVIEHVHKPQNLLMRCRQLLKPNGKIVVVTPNVDGLVHRKHRSNWLHLDPPRHIILFTAKSLQTLAEAAGFKSVNVETTIRSLALLNYSSQQIADKGRYNWGDNPKARFIDVKNAVSEWEAAFQVARGVDEGDELVLTANA